MATPVILIFDVGKTNKKIVLFDERYKVVHEESVQLEETKDEDGFACEDVELLTRWIKQKFSEILLRKEFDIKAVNFSAYGASFVHIDKTGKPVTPLYNYLKPYPENLKKQFYGAYGGESLIAKQTASPVLGSLNSGMQLYRLKYEKPDMYQKIKYSLHLPQYLSYIISEKKATDISSVGCHTNLWNFTKNDYHDWVYKEELDKKFAALCNGDKIVGTLNNNVHVGIGLHDSSAALIPYLASFHESFILLSTGTWCISLNPFNHSPLTDDELLQDCLCYLSYEGNPVKASRLFAGYEHEQQIKKIASYFNKQVDYFKTVEYDDALITSLKQKLQSSTFTENKLENFSSFDEAYTALIIDIVRQQTVSTRLVLEKNSTKNIFVDGGFSRNKIFMRLMANAFPKIKVCSATVAQASALGAALAVHKHRNKNVMPNNLVNLMSYKAGTE